MALTQISTAGVKDDAVTAGKIPANAVGSSELADNAVDTAAIATDAVTTAKIAAGNVTATELGTNAVTSAKLAAGAVSEAGKIADSIITGAKIGSGTIAAGNLATDSVTTAKIADSNVTTAKIATGAVNAAKIADNAVTTSNITDDAVTVGKIQNIAQDRILGRQSSGSGDVQELNAANVRTMLNVADGATYSNINGNVDNRVLTATGTTGVSQGEEKLTWNGNNLHIERTVAAYKQPLINIYNSGAYGWGGAIRFSANWANTEEHQATIRTYGGSSATGATLAFEVGASNSEKLRILPTGGIAFNGDTSTANALDDYEEGSWTPVYNPSSGSSGVSYSAQVGDYVKIGRLVMVQFYINYSASSASGSARISGLPFNPQNYGAGSVMMQNYDTDSSRWYVLHVSGNSNDLIYFYGTTDNGNWDSLGTDTNAALLGTISYLAPT